MKNFNWSGFEKGGFEVRCDTEEEMNDFLAKCEKRDYLWASGAKPTSKNYYVGKSMYFDGQDCELSYSKKSRLNYVKWIVEKVEEAQKDSLTWREVFATIQEGEIYEWGDYSIALKEGRINIGREGYGICFNDSQLFSKKQEQVDFIVAYDQMMNNGKVIKSCDFNCYYKRDGEGFVGSLEKGGHPCVSSISSCEMTGKWIVLE